jgi:hypothetical protein
MTIKWRSTESASLKGMEDKLHPLMAVAYAELEPAMFTTLIFWRFI